MSTIVVFTTLVIMLFILAKEISDPLKVFFIVTSLFLFLGYISIDEVISGFSNKGVITIALLFIVASAIENSYYFEQLTKFEKLDKLNFKPSSLFGSVTILSSFLNNTPIVSIFIPIVSKISKKTNISQSKLLMPISFLSALGGMLTLVGTSTNLVISGLMEDIGMEPLGFFEITKISCLSVLLGVIYILVFYDKLLPDNLDVIETNSEKINEFIVRFIVKKNSSIIGKSVQEAKLRNLSGVYLLEIERNNEKIFPITPNEIIMKDDILVFAGNINKIEELRCVDNLSLEVEYEIKSNYFNDEKTVLIEAIITESFDNNDLTIKDINFRQKYNSVIISVIRNGKRLDEKVGSIKLKTGDVLLLVSNRDNIDSLVSHKSLIILNTNEIKKTKKTIKDIYPILSFVCVILFSLIFNIDILYTSFMAVSFLLLTNTITVKQALNSIEYKTIILIAISFGIGKAIINTNSSEILVNLISPLIENTSAFCLLIIVFLITNIFTTIITNNAAAILSLPIVYEIAKLTNYDIRIFLIVMAISASCAFISPYGYQTNTMVYNIGGYKFKDFIKFGLPLTLIVMISSALIALTYL